MNNLSLVSEMQHNSAEKKLAHLNLTLPEVAKPIATYVPAVVVGEMVYISGQLPFLDGKLKYMGHLGTDVSEEEGAEAAELASLNVLAQLKAEVGSLDKVKRVVKLTGFVNSTPEFINLPKVINGASDLLVKVFGEKGKHARSAVGVASLPLGAAVEIEAIFEIE